MRPLNFLEFEGKLFAYFSETVAGPILNITATSVISLKHKFLIFAINEILHHSLLYSNIKNISKTCAKNTRIISYLLYSAPDALHPSKTYFLLISRYLNPYAKINQSQYSPNLSHTYSIFLHRTTKM